MNRNHSAFTLVELLVVIGILAILAGMLMPAIRTAMEKGERTQAKADATMLVTAWEHYHNKYGRWMFVDSESNIVMNAVVMSAMQGYYTNKDSRNPDNIQFLEINPKSIQPDGAFADPWTNTYRVIFDWNQDGKVSPPGTTIYESVAVWSLGPDHKGDRLDDPASWVDNINSWD